MTKEKIGETIKSLALVAMVYVVVYIVVYCMSMLIFGLIMIISNRSDEIIDKVKKLLHKMQEQIKLQINRICGKTKKYVIPDTSRNGGIWYNFNNQRSAS